MIGCSFSRRDPEADEREEWFPNTNFRLAESWGSTRLVGLKFHFRRRLNNLLGKMDMFLSLFQLFCLTLGRFREEFSPFFLLFDLPGSLFTFPMRGTIVPEMEIGIEHGRDDTPKFIDLKSHTFGENRKARMVRA